MKRGIALGYFSSKITQRSLLFNKRVLKFKRIIVTTDRSQLHFVTVSNGVLKGGGCSRNFQYILPTGSLNYSIENEQFEPAIFSAPKCLVIVTSNVF